MMSTVMGQALQAAGVKTPPESEIVWKYLRDNPKKTADDLRKILKVENIHGVMYDLSLRDMVWDIKEKRFNPKNGRNVFTKVYSVNKKMGDTYELLPRVKETTKAVKLVKSGPFTLPGQSIVKGVAAPPVAPVAAPGPVPTAVPDLALDLNLDSGKPEQVKEVKQKKIDVYDLDNMTLGELKALYAQLHRMFGV